ncbi:hypothetical protein [Anaerovirgula multivorans]|nr:hypothetical protein [Anaerovirgula multivorans]
MWILCLTKFRKGVLYMSAPVVSWRLGDNSDAISLWQIGTLNAGQQSAEQEILIWNNFQGAEDVAHMQDCKFTTTDGAADTMDVVANKWVYTRVDSLNESTFTQVGGATKHVIGAAGAAEGTIQGTANTGVLANTVNFAKLTNYFQSDLHGVSAGLRQFKLRVEYFYV